MMMETMINQYWNESAVQEKFAAEIDEAKKTVAKKSGPRRSRTQKQKDSIRKGKQRHDAALYRYKEEKVPVAGKLRFHQMPRDKGSDNIHNVRVEKAAKEELANFINIEVDILDPVNA